MFRRLIDSPWPYFVAAGILLIVAVASQFEIQLPSRPLGTPQEILTLKDRDDLNLVFIVVDTLRADRLGAYGYQRPTSQNLDLMAKYGILFKHVLSQSSWTKASMASLWTGTLPINNGIRRYDHALPDEALMPAEILKQAGFRTAGVFRNGWVAPNFGFAQGFDHYMNPTPGLRMRRAQLGHPAGGSLPGSDEALLESASAFLDQFGRERFMLYIHMMDIHQYVYDQDAPQFGTAYSDIYDQAIHWTDRVIAHIQSYVEQIGQLDNTIFVVTSDHGEAFREHGYEGHARNLYSEVVTVPWIISLPFRLEPGIVVEERVSNIDVWPTLLDLLGLPGLVNPDGRSVVPLILAAAGAGPADASFRRPVIGYLDRYWGQTKLTHPLVSVTDGDRRLVLRQLAPERSELYDLSEDPGEKRNLYDPEDPETQRLVGLAQKRLEEARNPWGVDADSVELDEMTLGQLRALGYVMK